ncbi:hypothetical protein H5410_042621 [Solanum commersonii]|uniref:Uncharacterized protein n=1 Tax=Solanum commersonii TaxID=4109 RepID=A0A9J5XUV4_SOLCO|nr:hypothetical protein H5410_042621 [Solanum commersonii]
MTPPSQARLPGLHLTKENVIYDFIVYNRDNFSFWENGNNVKERWSMRTSHGVTHPSKPGATSSTQKANPLLSLARGFELETSNMEVPSPNHWATPKGDR